MKCPFRCQTRIENTSKPGVEPVFLAFGTHGANELQAKDADSDPLAHEDQNVVIETDTVTSKLEKQTSLAVKLLLELADSDPETWITYNKKQASESGNSRWLVYTRAGRALEKISDIIGNEKVHVRDSLNEWHCSITHLKIRTCYDKLPRQFLGLSL